MMLNRIIINFSDIDKKKHLLIINLMLTTKVSVAQVSVFIQRF